MKGIWSTSADYRIIISFELSVDYTAVANRSCVNVHPPQQKHINALSNTHTHTLEEQDNNKREETRQQKIIKGKERQTHEM